MIYRLLFKHVLARIKPERAHALATFVLRTVTRPPLARRTLRRILGPGDECLSVHTLGLDFESPLGVAAGFDKDAKSFEGVATLGFGFVEVGTVTAHAQGGNPRPRVFRSIPDRAVVNSMGFPNPGADIVAERLARKTGQAIIGANIGKTKATPMSEVGEDYRASVARLAPVADYLVLNVSSPNTPGLRDLQCVERLRELVAAARSALTDGSRHIPLLVKIGPDLADHEIDAIADLSVELSLDGIVAVNTSMDLSGLTRRPEELGVKGPAGMSGAPLKQRALQVLEQLYARVGGQLVLVSVGGIEDVHDAWARILAGATLVQAHTGFVYGGPLWPKRVNEGLALLLRQAGFACVAEAVGASTRRHARTPTSPLHDELPEPAPSHRHRRTVADSTPVA